MERRKFIGGLASLLVSPMVFAGEPGDEKAENREMYKQMLDGFKKYYSEFREQTDKDDEFLKRVDERVSKLNLFPQYPAYQDWFKEIMRSYLPLLSEERKKELKLEDCEGFLTSTEVVYQIEKLLGSDFFDEGLSDEEAYERGLIDLLAISFERGFWKDGHLQKGIREPAELSKAYSDMIHSPTQLSLSEELMYIERKIWPNYEKHFDSLK